MPPVKKLSKQLTSRELKEALITYYAAKLKEILHERNNLSREDLEYVAERAAKLKDERLSQCIATLIGWGDEERAELETFCAVALEVMKMSSPSKLREAALRVEIRYHLNSLGDDGED